MLLRTGCETVVFVLVHVISFMLDSQQAKQMTRDLLSYQAGEGREQP